MENEKERQALIRSLDPRASGVDTRRVGEAPKSAHLRGFQPSSLGLRWPGARPRQEGPIPRDPGPLPGTPGASSRPLHVERAAVLGPPLGIRDIAALVGCSPWTVRQTLIPRGLPHFRFKANGRLIFYRDQVIRWIENQQGGPTTK
jgi:hypothetical protein